MPGNGRRSAQLARCYLVVLRFQLVDNILRRQLVFVHRVAVEPDAHRILSAKQLNVTDARRSADGIFNVRSDIVRDVILREIFVV